MNNKLFKYGITLEKGVQSNLNDCFKVYKLILSGELKSFNPMYVNKYHLKFLFKYYLKLKNIPSDKNSVYSYKFSKLLNDAKIWSLVKKRYHSSYEFIKECFPCYNLKEYAFKTLQVREGFWLLDRNCYDCIDDGLKKAVDDGYIKLKSDMCSFTIGDCYKYFHKSMIYFRGMSIIDKYLKYHNINNKNKLYYDGVRYDSAEESSVFRCIVNNFPELEISKNNSKKFYNILFDENYIPDFIGKFKGRDVIIEYFGIYVENPREGSHYHEYKLKTKRKVKFFNSMPDVIFVDVYPDDILNDFEGLKNKFKLLI